MINKFRGEYRFLSNFAPIEVTYNGLLFNSVEHAYVASKTENVMEQLTCQTLTAGGAKRFGKTLELRPDFDIIKLSVMEELLNQKFSNHYYRYLLFSTYDEELIEGNTWHDNFWGVCFCEFCGNTGKNNLGQLLMKIRSEITETQFEVVESMKAVQRAEDNLKSFGSVA